MGNGFASNERLEFLGDAVLNAVVADLVYTKFNNKSEGFLTDTRSKIVQRETLDRISVALELDKFIVSSLRSPVQKSHIAGNALEAFIGAIYLDQGYEVAKKFVSERIIAPYINMDALAKKEVNFKSKLLEWTQKYRIALDFDLIERFVDDDNNSIFQSQVTLNGVPAGVGTGYSKKESHQRAARMALKKIKTDADFVNTVKTASDDSGDAVE
jgi:ribonuclease-3